MHWTGQRNFQIRSGTMKPGPAVLLPAAIATALWGSATSAAVESCERLAGMARDDVLISTAAPVDAGPYIAPGTALPIAMPAFCRVAGTLRPSSDSRINFELW